MHNFKDRLDRWHTCKSPECQGFEVKIKQPSDRLNQCRYCPALLEICDFEEGNGLYIESEDTE